MRKITTARAPTGAKAWRFGKTYVMSKREEPRRRAVSTVRLWVAQMPDVGFLEGIGSGPKHFSAVRRRRLKE